MSIVSSAHLVQWQAASALSGAAVVERFLTHLATERNVAASTQNQALAAILFLYKAVLGIKLPWLNNMLRVKKLQRLPVVLTVEEVRRLFAHLDGQHTLMARLMSGAGLRVMEWVRLRVKDLDLFIAVLIKSPTEPMRKFTGFRPTPE